MRTRPKTGIVVILLTEPCIIPSYSCDWIFLENQPRNQKKVQFHIDSFRKMWFLCLVWYHYTFCIPLFTEFRHRSWGRADKKGVINALTVNNEDNNNFFHLYNLKKWQENNNLQLQIKSQHQSWNNFRQGLQQNCRDPARNRLARIGGYSNAWTSLVRSKLTSQRTFNIYLFLLNFFGKRWKSVATWKSPTTDIRLI